MMKKLSKDQKGFSLLELLVAVSILAVGILAAASMQGVALNSNALSNKISTSTMIAYQVMEDIYAWPRNDIRLKTGGTTPYDLNPDPGAPEITITIEGSGTYSATYTITPNAIVNGVTVPELTRIDVTIDRITENTGAQVLAPTVTLSSRGQNLRTTLTAYKRTV